MRVKSWSRRFVHLGSFLGYRPQHRSIREDDPIEHLLTARGAAKAAASMCLQARRRRSSLCPHAIACGLQSRKGLWWNGVSVASLNALLACWPVLPLFQTQCRNAVLAALSVSMILIHRMAARRSVASAAWASRCLASADMWHQFIAQCVTGKAVYISQAGLRYQDFLKGALVPHSDALT